MHKDVKEILITEAQIETRCKELALQIDKDYEGKSIVLIALLKGSIPFIAELSKNMESDVSFEYMKVSSYEGTESRELVITQDLTAKVDGQHVLIVEDILDTGKTLTGVISLLKGRKAASVKVVTMLDKKEGRVYDMEADYIGFDIPNAFVIGFGLDFNDRYRQLPYVGILKEECYK